MFGTFIRKAWQYDPTLYAPAAFRRACSYDAFIPNLLSNLEVSVSGEVAGTISDAEAAIRSLNEEAYPGLIPLARLLMRTESIASSKVEGMQVDARTLARAEANSDLGQKVSNSSLEIIGNIEAMQAAIEHATETDRIDLEQIIEVHRILMTSSDHPHLAGQIRDEQNWIGGNDYNPCGADFVPPPPEELDALLADLCAFCNGEALPPLMQAAIAHAQFETIHPYGDGNGRTGRALVQIILRRRGLSQHFVPPISIVLAANKERYIDGLIAYRAGDLEQWLEVFAAGAARAADLARRYLTEVRDLQEVWRERLRASTQVRRDAAAWQIIDVLPGYPVITGPVGVARVGRSKPAVNAAIAQLVSADVLIPVSQSQRNRAWEAAGLLDLLARLEAGELPDGDAEDEEPIGPPRSATGGVQTAVRLPWTDGIFRLGPGSWLTSVGEDPEVSMRIAVGVPNTLAGLGGNPADRVTLLRGQRREELLIERLAQSPLTEWLRELSTMWGGPSTVEWVATGMSNPEFSELLFAPFGFEVQRPPFLARSAFLTGHVDGGDAQAIGAIQGALDVTFNIIELDSNRRPSDVAHRVDPPPAPGALSIEEVADALHHLLDFVDLMAAVGHELLPGPRLTTVKIGEWLSFSREAPDRLVDLRRLRRLPRSAGLGQMAAAVALEPLLRGAQWLGSWGFVADLLYEGLEAGGYREIDPVIEGLRRRG